MPSIAQTDVYYIKKADNFIKNFLSQLNNIHDNAFSEVILERESLNIILEEMIKDRDKTLLYDNISRSYINNNYKTVQDYMDSYITYFKSNLNKLPGKYSVQNSLGTFKEDTVYKDTVVCIKFVCPPELSVYIMSIMKEVYCTARIL